MNIRVMIYVLPSITGIAVFASVMWFGDGNFVAFYEEKMRASLFTGFFTLSGFLMTAKTFIILNLKKEVFSTPIYLARVHVQSRLDSIEVYKPLRDIGRVLLVNVALCLAASISQFTVGLIVYIFAVAICLSLAAGAAVMLVFSLWIIAKNLNDMYEHFEAEAKEKIAEIQAKQIKSPPPIA